MSGDAMKFDRDDWRLSAYVAGELEPQDRAAVERLLAEDDEARAFVDELRVAAGELEAAFGAESAPALSEAQRGAVIGSTRATRWFDWRYAAAAAVLVAAAGAGVMRGWLAGDGGEAYLSYARSGESVAPLERASRDSAMFSVAGFGSVLPTATPAPSRALSDQLQPLGYLAGPSAGGNYRGPGDSVVPGWGANFEYRRDLDREQYDAVAIEGFRRAVDEAFSTFSIDVDTASYANVRRMLREGTLPPAGAVRVEEFVNSFLYDDPAPTGDVPFAVTTEVASCPWKLRHRLVRIGLKAKSIDWSERKPANLVFLLDVSGSMNSPDKLPLLQQSLRLLAMQLDHRDRVSIVVYAGAAGLVLPPTPGSRDGEIAGALERLSAGGSTNGGEGIELAYRLAMENYVEGGLNRVILATDGDFNVGVSDQSSLVALIESKRKSGVFLTVLGFGTGNLNDATMEQLADKGNGNYAYIDSIAEAKRVLVEQVGGTMIPVAKDVKIQVEWNPASVTAWRLIGYENRKLAHQDFADDTKDAGEIGAGLSVTALYEVVPAGVSYHGPAVGERRYEPQAGAPGPSSFAGELMFLKLRYKDPDGDTSRLIEAPVNDATTPWTGASADFRWSVAVAAFAELLRGNDLIGGFSCPDIKQVAWDVRGEDPSGRRAEFFELVDRTALLLR